MGPVNGNWSHQANWSNVINGSGGATLPGPLDSVIFSEYNPLALVHVDISPTIRALVIGRNVTLYASMPTVFRPLGTLTVYGAQTLKDSTSEDVPFNFVLDGSTRSESIIRGSWIFEGGVPVNHSAGNGAGFTVEPGAKLVVWTTPYPSGGPPLYIGSMKFKNNTRHISLLRR